MKNLIALLLFCSGIGFAQDSAILTDKEKVKGKLSITMLRELKSSLSTNFGKNLDSLKVITIFYYQPKANCDQDAYKLIKADKPAPKETKWVKSQVLYLTFEKNVSSLYIQHDKGASVYNAFFSENRGCEGLVTVDSDGNFILVKQRGTYSTANKFLLELQGKK